MKAKMKILYLDDKMDLQRPWTFCVTLRRWTCGSVTDYVYKVHYVSDEKEPGINPHHWHQTVAIEKLLAARSDAEAIRMAVNDQGRVESILARREAAGSEEVSEEELRWMIKASMMEQEA